VEREGFNGLTPGMLSLVRSSVLPLVFAAVMDPLAKVLSMFEGFTPSHLNFFGTKYKHSMKFF